MASVYFDSSALVKLLIEEEGSDVAAQLWDGCDEAMSSRLAYPEVRAALAAVARNGQLQRADLARTERTWDDYWATMRKVELNAELEQRAGTLTSAYALSGADAVHLAGALAIAEAGVVFAVWDRRLHSGAKTAGLTVAPGQL